MGLDCEKNKIYKVLLLDDEALVRTALKAFLKGTEFCLVAVSTAEEAEAALRHANFDIIVSDILMDPVDGFAFRDRVRRFDSGIPFIFLTSAAGGHDNSLFLRIMDDLFSYYLPKGAGANILLQKLRQVAQTFRTRQEARQQQAIIRRNHAIAATVQQALMPPWAYRGEGCEYAFLYKPFDKISGDLFEYFPQSEHSALFVFGDISGHGTHSALAMTALSTYLKQVINAENAGKPHEIANLINRFLRTELSGVVYVCAMILYWDFAKNILRVLNCGLPDILHCANPAGEVCQVSTDNCGAIPLGLMPNQILNESDTVEIHFPDDSVFLFFSDGILDQSRDELGNEMLSTDILKQLFGEELKKNGESGLWSLPYRIYHTLRERGYNHPQDDCSLVVIRKTPPAADDVFELLVPADYMEIDRSIQKASNYLRQKMFDEKACVKAELLLSEFLTNVLKHGMRNKILTHDCMVMRLERVAGSELHVCVWDRGKCWDQWLDAEPDLPPDDQLDELGCKRSVNGRGIPILRKVSQSITISHWDSLNKTVFKISDLKSGRSLDACESEKNS